MLRRWQSSVFVFMMLTSKSTSTNMSSGKIHVVVTAVVIMRTCAASLVSVGVSKAEATSV